MIKTIIKKIKYGIQKIRIMCMGKPEYINYLIKQGVNIGVGCEISKTANLGSEPFLIKIGNHTRITQRVQFITHDGGLWTLRRMGLISDQEVKYGSITIGDNCNISWDVIIMPNVHIGNNCVVAAGAVVTKNIPSGEVWGGIPAKRIESIEEYYNKIVSDTVPTYGMSMCEKEKYLKQNKPELFRH